MTVKRSAGVSSSNHGGSPNVSKLGSGTLWLGEDTCWLLLRAFRLMCALCVSEPKAGPSGICLVQAKHTVACTRGQDRSRWEVCSAVSISDGSNRLPAPLESVSWALKRGSACVVASQRQAMTIPVRCCRKSRKLSGGPDLASQARQSERRMFGECKRSLVAKAMPVQMKAAHHASRADRRQHRLLGTLVQPVTASPSGRSSTSHGAPQ